jgi:hypothetical protein
MPEPGSCALHAVALRHLYWLINVWRPTSAASALPLPKIPGILMIEPIPFISPAPHLSFFTQLQRSHPNQVRKSWLTSGIKNHGKTWMGPGILEAKQCAPSNLSAGITQSTTPASSGMTFPFELRLLQNVYILRGNEEWLQSRPVVPWLLRAQPL